MAKPITQADVVAIEARHDAAKARWLNRYQQFGDTARAMAAASTAYAAALEAHVKAGAEMQIAHAEMLAASEALERVHLAVFDPAVTDAPKPPSRLDAVLKRGRS